MRVEPPGATATPPRVAGSSATDPLLEPAVPLPRAIEVDPHHGQPLLCHGYTVLLTNPDGTITPGGRQGLFDHDTRVLSEYDIRLDDVAPRIDSGGLLDAARWMGCLSVPRPGPGARGPKLPQDSLELTLRRRIGLGMIEDIEVTNHSAAEATTRLVIALDSDFRDVAEAGAAAERRGEVTYHWDDRAPRLAIEFIAAQGTHALRRGMRIGVVHADSPAFGTGSEFTFDLRLPPHGQWHARLMYEVLVDDRWHGPIDDMRAGRDRIAADWQRHRMHVESDPPTFGLLIERAADDLLALRNWEYDAAPDAWVPNAGVPSYTGLFGRDVLTAGWQSALLGPEIMRGALARLAATQSTVDSAWHDAEPGKMIHEMRRGPLSELDIIPQRGYYGTQTSSSFFVVTLSELWHWTGDLDIVRSYLDAALRTFEWAERYGDRDADGFLEYERRSARGLKNQGWKDSDEAIRYPDGALVENPIATVEEQAYHWLALQRMAELLTALDDTARTEIFLKKARRLRAAWHQSFWLSDRSFYAMALDPGKRPVASPGSNPGHALAAGLVPIACARAVADRLMAPDLFSGWGIRTLSSDHPSYNPLAYHLGTVWPVENATIALGFKRYGLDEHVERLATAMFDAADCFRYARLPEALGGHPRQNAPIPTVYPGSNSPQAWSASAVVQLAQTILGIYPFAPASVLALVRPALPRWLRSVTVRNLRIGSARISIRFHRSADGATRHEILDRTGTLHTVQVAPPQDVAADRRSWGEVVSTWLLGHAPGRTAAALRIALGDDA
jgi:glycogen debranching enzyme